MNKVFIYTIERCTVLYIVYFTFCIFSDLCKKKIFLYNLFDYEIACCIQRLKYRIADGSSFRRSRGPAEKVSVFMAEAVLSKGHLFVPIV